MFLCCFLIDCLVFEADSEPSTPSKAALILSCILKHILKTHFTHLLARFNSKYPILLLLMHKREQRGLRYVIENQHWKMHASHLFDLHRLFRLNKMNLPRFKL